MDEAGEEGDVDDDRDEGDADERRDDEGPDEPAADQPARDEGRRRPPVVHDVAGDEEGGDRQQGVAERADDLALGLGRREGEDDAAERPADEDGPEEVGPAQQVPATAADEDDERGDEQGEADEPDGRREA